MALGTTYRVDVHGRGTESLSCRYSGPVTRALRTKTAPLAQGGPKRGLGVMCHADAVAVYAGMRAQPPGQGAGATVGRHIERAWGFDGDQINNVP
jgi:hypothetical protein